MTFNQWWYDFKIKNHGRQPERSIAEAAWAAARMAAAPSEGVTCPECATARAAANSWKDELMRLKSAQPAARATKDFAALCRPAVKSALTKAEMSLLGKYPDHYKPILEGEANRMRELLDEIDAILDGRGVSASGFRVTTAMVEAVNALEGWSGFTQDDLILLMTTMRAADRGNDR